MLTFRLGFLQIASPSQKSTRPSHNNNRSMLSILVKIAPHKIVSIFLMLLRRRLSTRPGLPYKGKTTFLQTILLASGPKQPSLAKASFSRTNVALTHTSQTVLAVSFILSNVGRKPLYPLAATNLPLIVRPATRKNRMPSNAAQFLVLAFLGRAYILHTRSPTSTYTFQKVFVVSKACFLV